MMWQFDNRAAWAKKFLYRRSAGAGVDSDRCLLKILALAAGQSFFEEFHY